jgi:peroxiredoxin
MKHSAPLFVLLAAVAVASTAVAGEFNPTLSVGNKAPDWSKLPGVDGKEHSLADLKDKQAVVLVFTCNSCPYAVEYEDRIMALAKKYGGADGKVAVVAVNVNKVPEDSFDKMKARAKERNFNYPYLYDETQKIAKDYGATSTPEFFVLAKDRTIAYMGALDDETDSSKVKVRYVEDALDAVLKGDKPKTTETVARGCLVRYAKERRKPATKE